MVYLFRLELGQALSAGALVQMGCAALAPLGLVWSGWLPATKTAIEFFWMDVVVVVGVAHVRKPFCIYTSLSRVMSQRKFTTVFLATEKNRPWRSLRPFQRAFRPTPLTKHFYRTPVVVVDGWCMLF